MELSLLEIIAIFVGLFVSSLTLLTTFILIGHKLFYSRLEAIKLETKVDMLCKEE